MHIGFMWIISLLVRAVHKKQIFVPGELLYVNIIMQHER